MKIKWSSVKQALQILATIITTVLGTIAVQSCAPHWFWFRNPLDSQIRKSMIIIHKPRDDRLSAWMRRLSYHLHLSKWLVEALLKLSMYLKSLSIISREKGFDMTSQPFSTYNHNVLPPTSDILHRLLPHCGQNKYEQNCQMAPNNILHLPSASRCHSLIRWSVAHFVFYFNCTYLFTLILATPFWSNTTSICGSSFKNFSHRGAPMLLINDSASRYILVPPTAGI